MLINLSQTPLHRKKNSSSDGTDWLTPYITDYTYIPIIIVMGSRKSMILLFPAGRLLLGILASEMAIGPLQQWHILLFHRTVRPFELGPLVGHHTRGRHVGPSGGIPARGHHTVINPFPRFTEELLFFPA